MVISDAAEDVVEDSSRNDPTTTMKRQMSFAEAESAGKKRARSSPSCIGRPSHSTVARQA
ncbi:hypothetical protein A33K_18659 [Burkholderia humptydooensis MSMB43]|uniref:Uncharacterized protein n=1 Tax=Burkholderia humptydooensis MSMB43 TaxID=441157 RepID=A0ABN0FXG5_9BURK|nr:hypothetical protein A33K_18659 [Burkholderia humptydooensis MSMB43]